MVLRFAGMTTRAALVAVSRAQLVAQLAGLTVALRRGRYYDVGFMRGSPEHDPAGRALVGHGVQRAAAYMLAAQAWATARLRRAPADGARRCWGCSGVLMVPGYLMERSGRAHLRRGGLDPVETPIVLAGLGLAAAMGVLGHRDQAGR